jgi:hypothetical protein
MQSTLQKLNARCTLIKQHFESLDTACEGLYIDKVSSFHRSRQNLLIAPRRTAVTVHSGADLTYARVWVDGAHLQPARLEAALAVINIRLADLLFGIHDEGTPCHDRLAKRAACKEQSAEGRSAASDVQV